MGDFAEDWKQTGEINWPDDFDKNGMGGLTLEAPAWANPVIKYSFHVPDTISCHGKQAPAGIHAYVRVLGQPDPLGCDDPGDYVLHLLPVQRDLRDGANV